MGRFQLFTNDCLWPVESYGLYRRQMRARSWPQKRRGTVSEPSVVTVAIHKIWNTGLSSKPVAAQVDETGSRYLNECKPVRTVANLPFALTVKQIKKQSSFCDTFRGGQRRGEDQRRTHLCERQRQSAQWVPSCVYLYRRFDYGK